MKKLLTIFTVLLGLALSAGAQSIRGTVHDETGEPLSGATLVARDGQYAITGMDGSFTLKAARGSSVTVSFLGYEDFVLTVGDQQVYRIEMVPSAATMLDEAVAIGYGKTTRKEVTGSVASLKADDLDKGSFTNAAGMLQGKVAGLSVTNPDGGDPNASFEILLRGTNTLVANQGPLIIIDGVADADLRTINFQEVESIDVLKDGSAAAIYGTRGTNGVVIITTKRAKAGANTVEYDGQVTVQTVAARATPLTAAQFTDVINKYKPAAAGSLYGSDTDWFAEVTRVPVSHKHSIAVSGGTENFSHRTVLNTEQNQGLQKGNDVSKYLIKTNIHQEAIQGLLSLDYNLSYTRRSYTPANYGVFRQAFMHNPTEPVYSNDDPAAGGYSRIQGMDYYNPVAMLNELHAHSEADDMGANVRATFKIPWVEGLKWDNFISWNSNRYNSWEYSTKYYPGRIGKDGQAYIYNSSDNSLQWESTVQYSRVFGPHSVQAVAGYTWQRNESTSSSGENYGFDNDMLEVWAIGTGSALKNGLAELGSWKEASRYIAFFGRVMYNYKEKYLLSASLRRDGSTRFGADHKWGWFPAVSLGWRLNREEWLEDAGWLDELKLRAGFGVTGNQDFANYKSLMLMSPKGHYFSNGKWQNAYAPASNANPDLGWERKNEFDAGVDFSVFAGRLSGSLDVYYRLTTDLLYNYNVPVPPYDYKSLFTNVGSISNGGVELTLNAIPVKTEKLSWNTTLTFARNVNKLISFTNEEFKDGEYKIGSIGDPVNVYCQRLVEGGSLGTFFGPEWIGIRDDGDDDFKNSIIGKVSEEDWSRLGSAYPDFTIGWSNSLRYGNWSLSASIRAAIGGKVFNYYRQAYENLNAIGLRNIISSWLDDTSFTGKTQYSSKYLEDATYVKLDNLSLSYDVPYSNKYVKGVRLYLSGQNLLCLTAYRGVDPEVSLSGLAPGIEGTSYYPRTRSFTFGANVRF